MTAATPEEIRRITQNVLDRPEFLPRLDWTRLIFETVWKWLRQIAEWSARNPDLSKWLIIVLSILLVLLLAHIIYTVVREFMSIRGRDSAHVRQRPVSALEGIAENWSDAFRVAGAALDAGDLYKAVWVTHRILLSVLDRMEQIKFVLWKTNSDYLRECRESSLAAATLTELTDAYERVIYAHRHFDRQEVVTLLARVEALAAEAHQ